MKSRKPLKVIFIIIGILLLSGLGILKYKHISPISWGIHSEVNQAIFSDAALNGYDPVAYFTDGHAIIGNKNLAYRWKNATWYFASQEHLNLFKIDPEKYAPQLGGYCAFAASKGFTANPDPDVRTVNFWMNGCRAEKRAKKNLTKTGNDSCIFKYQTTK